jgi:MFS family permease
VFFLTAATTSAPLGRAVERIGWRRAMRVNAVASAIVLVAIAMVANSTLSLAVLLFVGGTVYGFANPAANASLAEAVDPRRRGLTFGLKHAGIPASTLLAGLAVPLVVLTVGWRASFAVSATLVVAVLLLIPGVDADDRAPAGATEPGRGADPLPVGYLVGLGFAAAFATSSAVTLATFLVAAMVDSGFTEASAGLLLFAGSAASISARVGVGGFTDRRGARGFGGLVVLMSTGAMVFLVLPAVDEAVLAMLVVVAFATAWGWPGLMTFTVVNANVSSAAASSGITQAGIFVGAGAGPILFGWLVHEFSFEVSWLVVAGALATAATIVSIVGARSRRLAISVRP